MEETQETPTLIRQCQRNQATFFLHDNVKDPSFFQPRPSPTLYIIHHCASSLAVIHPLLYHLFVPWSDTDAQGQGLAGFHVPADTSTLARYFYWSNRTNIQSDSNHRTRRIHQTETQLLLRQYASTRRSPFLFLSRFMHALRPSFPGQHLCPRFFTRQTMLKPEFISLWTKERERENDTHRPRDNSAPILIF